MSGIAILGTGMWGPRLAEAASRAELELVACFSRDEARRREFAEMRAALARTSSALSGIYRSGW